MSQHTDLTSVMGIMGDHVSEHGNARTPWPRPSIAEKALDAVWRSDQSFCQHLAAARGTFGKRRSSLFLSASRAVKLSRPLDVRSGKPQPFAPNVVNMSENSGDRAPSAARRLRPPGPWIEMLQYELVHSIVQRKGLRHLLRKVVTGYRGDARHVQQFRRSDKCYRVLGRA